MAPWTTPRASLRGSTMNTRRVIILMTVAVFFVLTVLAVVFFHGLPLWPVLLCFAVSHTAFCLLVASVKPYRGPYKEPMADPEPGDWPQP